MNQQGQLWNAGPVAVLPKSHKRGAPPVLKQCREPGCTRPRRIAQAARYCEVHARAKNYIRTSATYNEAAICLRCGQDFTRPRNHPDISTVVGWRDFCPGCHRLSPLVLNTIRRHNVPADLVRRWLMVGPDLRCERPGCGKLLRSRRPCIDHDHGCCEDFVSCGGCIRGIVCSGCNGALGYYEMLLRDATVEELAFYVRGRAYDGEVSPRNRTVGRPVTCTCGTCRTCLQRFAQQRYVQRQAG